MRWLLENRFKVLLLSLMGVLVTIPLITDLVTDIDPRTGRVAVFGLTSFLLVVGALGVSDRRGILVATLGVVIAVVLLDAAAHFLAPGNWVVIHHVLRLGFLIYVVVVLLRYLFRPGLVTFDTLSASLCVYLLLGLCWENVFTAVETLRPGSFVRTVPAPVRSGQVDTDTQRSMEMLYFSFATLSTVGYGDIVPVTATARMLAVTAAMAGQGYLLVMVSRLVGMYGAQAFARPASPGAAVAQAAVPDAARTASDQG
jgi:hypothetical protein